MECSQPGVIRDDELLAYLAGENVRSVVTQHLVQCMRCSSLLVEYRELEQSLLQKFYRRECPSNHILGEYQLGLLADDLTYKVQSHLGQCILCSAEVASLTAFLANDPMLSGGAVVQTISHNNHAGTRQALKGLLKDVQERTAEQKRRIIAALVPPPPRLAFQRNVAASAWPRRYTAEDLSISIQREPSPGHSNTVQIIGFVARKGASLESLQGIPVLLSSSTSDEGLSQTQHIDELGNFVFVAITPATYSLEVQMPGSTVIIEQLPVDLQDD